MLMRFVLTASVVVAWELDGRERELDVPLGGTGKLEVLALGELFSPMSAMAVFKPFT